jgi:hypothetical protein
MQATLTGEFMAIRDAFVAIISLQPDIAAVAERMRQEREETLTLLLNKGVPEATIEAYRDTIDSIRPHRNGEDMNPP